VFAALPLVLSFEEKQHPPPFCIVFFLSLSSFLFHALSRFEVTTTNNQSNNGTREKFFLEQKTII